MALETQTLGWKDQIIVGDWHDNTFYPGKLKNKRGEDIQTKVKILAGKTRWK